MDTYACSSLDQPVTYSVKVVSGGGGKAPAPAAGSTGPGVPIGTVRAALRGNTIYSGTVVTTSNVYWYQLYKPSGTGTATVRFEDTTAAGSAPCSDIGLQLDGADGTNSVLDSAALGANSAVTYSVSDAGQYYVEIYAYACGGSDGATYSIEPNPAAGWSGAPAVTSISPVKGPARGGNLVHIHGTWLAGVSAVRFGSSKGTKIHVLSSGELSVIAPKHAKGTVNVTVSTGDGTSATGAKTRYTFT